jgi:hypothetical protein
VVVDFLLALVPLVKQVLAVEIGVEKSIMAD